MRGSPCPNCGKQVMPFGQFFRHAEPTMVIPCPSCGVSLSRSAAVYIPLVVIGLAIMVLAFLLAPGRPLPIIVLAGVIGVVAATAIVKVVNYKLPFWRAAEKPDVRRR